MHTDTMRNETITISSQRYLDEDTVAEKSADRDYTVTVSPSFDLDGSEYRVVIDGHHSLAAAMDDGVEPDYIVATKQMSDNVTMLEYGDIEGFLDSAYMDSDWYIVDNGQLAF